MPQHGITENVATAGLPVSLPFSQSGLPAPTTTTTKTTLVAIVPTPTEPGNLVYVVEDDSDCISIDEDVF
jgi:hypothetical protein